MSEESGREITGMMVYYAKVCERKLWLFTHYIELEDESELVAIGAAIDENSFRREQHNMSMLPGISADFIGANGIVHEVKKGKSIPEADRAQLLFYLYRLDKAGFPETKGILHYMENHSTEEVRLTAEARKEIEGIMDKIHECMASAEPPPYVKKRMCLKCAYYELCAI